MHSGFLTKANLVTDTSDKNSFLDPQLWLEGSYQLGSVLSVCLFFHLYFRLSISFLRIGSLVFSET